MAYSIGLFMAQKKVKKNTCFVLWKGIKRISQGGQVV